MEVKMRRRAIAVADLIEPMLPDAPDRIDDMGPSARRTLAVTLAIVAVDRYPGSAEAVTREFLEDIRILSSTDEKGESAINRFTAAIAHCRMRDDRTETALAGNECVITADRVEMIARLQPKKARTQFRKERMTILMSHSTGLALIEEDATEVPEERMEKARMLATNAMARAGIDMTRPGNRVTVGHDTYRRGSLAITPTLEDCQYVGTRPLRAAQIAHGSAKGIELAIDKEVAWLGSFHALAMRARRQFTATLDRVRAIAIGKGCRVTVTIDAMPMTDGRDVTCRMHMHVMNERLTIRPVCIWTGQARDNDGSDIDIENVTRYLDEHARRSTIVDRFGGMPGHACWRFDRVLLALADTQDDPEAFLAALLADESVDRDEQALGRLCGRPDIVGTTRAREGVMTVKIALAPGIHWSHGTLTIDRKVVTIPEVVVQSLKGRRLRDVLDHPLTPGDAEIVVATTTPKSIVVQTRREVQPYRGLAPMAMAA